MSAGESIASGAPFGDNELTAHGKRSLPDAPDGGAQSMEEGPSICTCFHPWLRPEAVSLELLWTVSRGSTTSDLPG